MPDQEKTDQPIPRVGDLDQQTDSMTIRDYLLLGAFCLIVYGVSLISGRELTMHEAVLPQSARSMLADSDWVVPKKGGAPWLESPPLPQWCTVAIASVIGRCDEVWIVRIGPVIMATAVVLMVAWMATLWFGRSIGLLSGFIMATTCQLARYAWLAEDEIYLCALVTAAVALFVRLEFGRDADASSLPTGFVRSFLGRRSWGVLALFVMLGLTNLAKGLLFGTVMALIPIAAFLLWNADWRRISRYVWLWGWLAFVGVMLAWPTAVYQRFPDVVELWNYDLGGRLTGTYTAITQPVWYYAANLPWIIAPWTLVVPVGLWLTRREALTQRCSPQRFLWCWAILVPVVFSIPQGKHHHYLLHSVAPWAVLSSFGLIRVRDWMLSWPRWARHPLTGLVTIAAPSLLVLVLLRDKVTGPDWLTTAVMIACPFMAVLFVWGILHPNRQLAARMLFGSLAVAYCFGHWYAGAYVDTHRLDVAFLRQVDDVVEPDKPLLLDMEVGDLRGFLCLFYLDDKVRPLHNLSFALDDRIQQDDVYLVTRYRERSRLEQFSKVGVVLRSEKTGGEESPDDRLTLFRLNYRDGIPRLSAAGKRISPMQSMYRTLGPYLGKRL